MTSRTAARRRGQALTEFALIAPLAILLVLGTYDLSIMATDKGLAVSAVRHAARSGAELGGTNSASNCTGSLPAGTQLSDVDASIVQTVLASTANMSYLGGVGAGFAPTGRPEEIDIYHPAPFLAGGATNTSGVIDTSSNHYEKFTYANDFVSAQPGPTPYALSERCQGPLASDTDIGVRLIWSYRPANGIPGPFVKNISEYAVERMALCSDNCNHP